jgi:hypothetical protein
MNLVPVKLVFCIALIENTVATPDKAVKKAGICAGYSESKHMISASGIHLSHGDKLIEFA